MSFWERIRKVFGFGPDSWTNPDSVECSARYRSLLRECYWEAAARLEKIGVDRRHKVVEFKVRKGEVLRPGGWAVPHEGSPTGYAGGYATEKTWSGRRCATNGPRQFSWRRSSTR